MLLNQLDEELGRDISTLERTVTSMWQHEQQPSAAGSAAQLDAHSAALHQQLQSRQPPSRGMAGFSYSGGQNTPAFNPTGSLPDAAAPRVARKPAPSWNSSTNPRSLSLPSRLAGYDAADRAGLQAFQARVKTQPTASCHGQDAAAARLSVPIRRAPDPNTRARRRRQAWSDASVQIGEPYVHNPEHDEHGDSIYSRSTQQAPSTFRPKIAGQKHKGKTKRWHGLRSPRERQAEFARVAGGEASFHSGLPGAAGH
eukprot:COSAG05_NODE_6350_length_976_cov_1.261117_1_plen_254_part_10